MHLAVTPKDFSHSRHITYSSSVQFRFPLIPNTFSIYSKAIFSSIRDLKDWIGLMWAGLVHSSLPHLRACCICVNALSAIWLQPWLPSKNKEPEWTSENRRENWQSYYNFLKKWRIQKYRIKVSLDAVMHMLITCSVYGHSRSIYLHSGIA